MESLENASKSKKKLFLPLVAVLILVAIIVVIIVLSNKNNNNQGENNVNTPNQSEESDNSAAVDVNSGEFDRVELENQESAQVVVPGSNPITGNNIVVAKNGAPAKNDAPVMSDEAPQQTGFLNRDELPEEVFQIEIGNGKISPASFTTRAGAPTVFSLSGIDSFAHTISFDDPGLSAIAVLVGPNQTKAITFNAPTEPGTYTFRCMSPGHADKGEVGEMIVE
jgi:uncharacterized cupredoxin-like copper-binding protein